MRGVWNTLRKNKVYEWTQLPRTEREITVEKIQRGNFTPVSEQISEQTDGFPRDGQMLCKGIHPQRSWPRVP